MPGHETPSGLTFEELTAQSELQRELQSRTTPPPPHAPLTSAPESLSSSTLSPVSVNVTQAHVLPEPILQTTAASAETASTTAISSTSWALATTTLTPLPPPPAATTASTTSTTKPEVSYEASFQLQHI